MQEESIGSPQKELTNSTQLPESVFNALNLIMASNVTNGRGRRISGEVEKRIERQAEAWRLRVEEGMPIRKIAKRLGVSAPTISGDIHEVRERVRTQANELCEQYLSEQLEDLDTIREQLMRYLAADHINISEENEKGDIVQTVKEYDARMNAADKMLKLMKRTADLLGLDAAKRIEIDVTNHMTMDAWEKTKEAVAARSN